MRVMIRSENIRLNIMVSQEWVKKGCQGPQGSHGLPLGGWPKWEGKVPAIKIFTLIKSCSWFFAFFRNFWQWPNLIIDSKSESVYNYLKSIFWSFYSIIYSFSWNIGRFQPENQFFVCLQYYPKMSKNLRFRTFFGRFLNSTEWPKERNVTGGSQNYTFVFL